MAERTGASQLHATDAGPVDLPGLRDQFSHYTRAAIDDPSATPESVGAHARVAARAGRILLDGEKADRWIISGGPDDDEDRSKLQNDFRAEAVIAAIGADETTAEAGDQQALEAWIELLVRSLRPHGRRLALTRLAHVSAEMCRQLQTRAYREKLIRESQAAAPAEASETGTDVDDGSLTVPHTADQRATVKTIELPATPLFPRRKAWFEQRAKEGIVVDSRRESHVTATRIAELSGLSHHTVLHAFQGDPVKPRTLKAIADILQMSVDEIPND
jgi:hypothetical protein